MFKHKRMNGYQKWCVSVLHLRHVYNIITLFVCRCVCLSLYHFPLMSLQENIPPPVTPQDNLTPCAKTTMVSAASPLGVIQYSSVISRRQSIPSPMSNLLHTPTHFPTLLENTAKLTITDEEKGDIRRCLFPFDRDPTPVANKHLTEKISKRSSKARLKRL